MSRIVVAMCTYVLMGNNSMKGRARWLADPKMGKEMGLDKGLSQRTMNKAVNLIGCHSDEMIVKLWEGLDSRYHFDNTDINIDDSQQWSTARMPN